ncbi:MAG: hypothetical protein ACE5J7_03185 [Candidatus Aenigmatarchaeota archaeon]
MHQLDLIKYYSRKDVQATIVEAAKEREVGGTKRDGTFTSRPDVLQYPRDVIERVKNGVVAFHLSVEKWTNPLSLKSAMSRKELDELRKEWDMIIDIDAKAKLEHARAAAIAVVDLLKDMGISPTVKFSGSRGFHIGIASNAFPNRVDSRPVAQQYPEIPQAIAGFIREKARDKIMDSLIRMEGGHAALTKTVGKIKELSPYEFVEIEKDWGSRHMFRAPYSLHNKTWLASVPIPLFKLKSFKKESANPEKVKARMKFLVSKDLEAQNLLVDAVSWRAKHRKEEVRKKERRVSIKRAIPEQHFPVCIKRILEGTKDGRKRSIFTLISFLRSVNWQWDDIEKKVMEWNKSVGLSDRFVTTQLKWHSRQRRAIMPPNCGSDLFYKSIGICTENCGKVKNPVNYAFRSYRKAMREKRKG